jgi:3,4-dihydroxy 2-butanone 4-phosphate synthase/GTP cyclohydrolase II
MARIYHDSINTGTMTGADWGWVLAYLRAMSVLDPISEAIEAIRSGEIIIVVDDEDRENEGDFLTAARNVTPEVINFMATHGRGLICAPLIEDRCDELGLELMVNSNNAAYETPFTVSVDLLGHGCTTGISASDRSKTVAALIDPETRPEELGKPGHIFPLRAKRGGVLRRAGHTEAAIDFARLAGFEPAGVIVEIMNEDGTMARLPACRELADRFGLKLVSIADLIAYRLEHDTLIKKETTCDVPTEFGTFRATAYRQTTNDVVHLAMCLGQWQEDEPVPVRVHHTDVISDLFMTLESGRGRELRASLNYMSQRGKGVVVLINKLPADGGLLSGLLNHQTGTPPAASPMDSKDYGIGAQILRDCRVRKLEVLSDRPRKRGIIGYGLEIVDTVAIAPMLSGEAQR